MAVKNFNYSCGGNSAMAKKIQFKIDDESGVITEATIYEGPCDLITGEFFINSLKKTVIRSESDIQNHLAGIKLKLKETLNVSEPKFIF